MTSDISVTTRYFCELECFKVIAESINSKKVKKRNLRDCSGVVLLFTFDLDF